MDALLYLYLAKFLFLVAVVAFVVLIFSLLPSKKVEPPSGSSYMGTNQTWTAISGTIVMVCFLGAVFMGLAQCAGLMDVPSNLGYPYP